MASRSREEAWAFYAQTYDVSVSDWPGEIDFYKRLAAESHARGEGVLELACGTGRVAIRLAQEGVDVVGLDLSRPMLEVAREKAMDITNARWIEGDMRSFNLAERFGLIIIPGHAFQNLITPQDQIACLEAVRRHLTPEGQLVVHVDHVELDWLGDLYKSGGSPLKDTGEFIHPVTGSRIRARCSWNYKPSEQTAMHQTIWEEVAADGSAASCWETGEVKIHCVFRYEMEHALRRAGFDSLVVLGDFSGGKLADGSSEMIWIAKAH